MLDILFDVLFSNPIQIVPQETVFFGNGGVATIGTVGPGSKEELTTLMEADALHEGKTHTSLKEIQDGYYIYTNENAKARSAHKGQLLTTPQLIDLSSRRNKGMG